MRLAHSDFVNAHCAVELGRKYDIPVPQPNFGGNPNNGAFMLNRAQAQNSYKDPSYDDDFGIETPSARIILLRPSSRKY